MNQDIDSQEQVLIMNRLWFFQETHLLVVQLLKQNCGMELVGQKLLT